MSYITNDTMNYNDENLVNDIKKNILEKYESQIKLMKEVYIFGTKSLGIKTLNCLKKLDLKILGFIDNDKKIKGNYIDGIKVFGLNEISLKADGYIIIASIMYMNEIIEQLKEKSFINFIPYPILSLWNEEVFPEQFTLIDLQIDLVKNNMEYKNMYSSLEDDKSKYILSNIINFRKTLNFQYMNLCYDEKKIQYFDEDLVKLDKDEVFLDGGAFNGDSAINFIKQSNYNYKKIYLFEPDIKLLDEARNNLNSYNNIVYNCYGLYREEKELKFEDTGGVDGTISENGNTKIKVVSIDNFIKEKITFIKLDIEGEEIEAIKGAEKQIRDNKPKLAIAIYHRNSDIWSIFKLIQAINPNYRFYLRHYTRNVADTVLYCI